MDNPGVVNHDALDNACSGLKSSVKHFIKKQHTAAAKHKLTIPAVDFQKYQKEANDAVEHACHLLWQLSYKRCSLWHGIQQLSQSWKKEYIKYLQSQATNDYSKWLFPVLCSFFQHYLRLRDGSVLLTSGECRHDGDVFASQKTKFPSRLTLLSNQADGYTKIYSASHYSGFAWDEFFQESVGIQTRLVQSLQRLSRKKKQHVWDYLLNHGAQLFESTLDMHETYMGRIKNKLQQLDQAFCRDLEKVLKSMRGGGGGTVTLVTLDKMERLNVVIHGTQKTRFGLERLGDNFKVVDKGGVLPNGWTQNEWHKVMKLPADLLKQKNMSRNAPSGTTSAAATTTSQQPLRKKRRIIDSSDDESEKDEPQQQQEQQQGGGLKVIQETETKSAAKPSSSLNAIKKGLGVNVAELEASREVAEAEEKQKHQHQTSTLPQQQTLHQVLPENANQEEARALHGEIAETSAQVKMFRRALKRVMKENDDDNDVWDARECLRESIMRLGDLLRSLHAALDDNDDKKTSGSLLQQAEALFREAVCLVLEQKAAHCASSKETNDFFTAESLRIEVCLWHVRGRAYINLGMSLVEQSLLKTRKAHAQALLNKGIVELKNAQNCAKTMRQTNSDKDNVASLEADQLECLASRWLAIALWHQGLRVESKNVIESAVGLCKHGDSGDVALIDDLLEARISLGVEGFDTAATFAEMAYEALDKLPTRSCEEKNGTDLLAMAVRGHQLAKSTSLAIQELTTRISKSRSSSFEEVKAQHNLKSADEISIMEKELKQWWEKKKAAAKPIAGNEERDDPALPRNDLFTDGQPPSNAAAAPKRRFVVTGGTLKPSTNSATGWRSGGNKSRKSSTARSSSLPFLGSEDDTFGASFFHDLSDEQNAAEQIQFRKWGDDLLPDVPGKPGVKLQYPSIAPERPAPNVSSQ